MGRQRFHDEVGERHRPIAGVGLRRRHLRGSAWQEDELLLHGHQAAQEVDMAGLQPEALALS